MQRTRIHIFIAMLLFFIPFLVGAQGNNVTEPVPELTESVTIPQDVKTFQPNAFQNIRERLENKVTNVRQVAEEKNVTDETGRAKGITIQKTETVRENTLKRQEEKKGEVLKKRADKEKERLEKRAERIHAYFEKMFRRLDAAIERQVTLAERVDSRIQKVKERGVATEVAEQSLNTARASIEEAKVALTEAKNSVESVVAGDNAKDIFAQTKEVIKSVIALVKESHKALVDSIVILSGKKSDDSETQ